MRYHKRCASPQALCVGGALEKSHCSTLLVRLCMIAGCLMQDDAIDHRANVGLARVQGEPLGPDELR